MDDLPRREFTPLTVRLHADDDVVIARKQLVSGQALPSEGVTVIVNENSPNDISVAQTLPTQRGARTIVLDPRTHRIYLPTADFEPPPTRNARPAIVSNTMRLLVYGPQ